MSVHLGFLDCCQACCVQVSPLCVGLVKSADIVVRTIRVLWWLQNSEVGSPVLSGQSNAQATWTKLTRQSVPNQPWRTRKSYIRPFNPCHRLWANNQKPPPQPPKSASLPPPPKSPSQFGLLYQITSLPVISMGKSLNSMLNPENRSRQSKDHIQRRLRIFSQVPMEPTLSHVVETEQRGWVFFISILVLMKWTPWDNGWPLAMGCRDAAGDEGLLDSDGIEFSMYHTRKTIHHLRRRTGCHERYDDRFETRKIRGIVLAQIVWRGDWTSQGSFVCPLPSLLSPCQMWGKSLMEQRTYQYPSCPPTRKRIRIRSRGWFRTSSLGMSTYS